MPKITEQAVEFSQYREYDETQDRDLTPREVAM